MKKLSGWLPVALLASSALMGCAGGGADQKDNSAEVGTLALPLITNGPSGTQYQLRNATFQIQSYRYYYEGVGGGSVGGATSKSGPRTSPAPIIVSSETNPSAPSIEVSLEEGDYQITLLPGWSLESIVDGVTTPLPEVQLLSGETQWVWVSPHSTSWVNYQFGIGDRAVWFNGKLNVEIQVYENPDQYYGPSYGGSGGSSGGTWMPAGGMPVAAGGTTGF